MPEPRTVWTSAAIALALAVAGLTSVFLLRIPVQLSDSFTEFTTVSSGTLTQIVRAEFQGGPYMRPFRRGLTKVVYDLSGGRYQTAFRGFQAAQLVALLLLVVTSLRVRTRDDAAVVPVALAFVLAGHTFAGAILEGLPINHFLTILICCAAALTLTRAKPSVLVDIAAVAVLVFAMLTIESGLVVAAVLVGGYLVGYRGVSRPALVAVTLCVLAYGIGRFGVLGGETPGLTERSAGFGFRVLSTDELVRRFGENPLPFHIYNVVSGVSSVLFAEPRGGVWELTRGLVQGRPEPWRLISVASTTLVTLVMMAFAAPRVARWIRGRFDSDAERLLVLFVLVLAANAIFVFAYEKDAILGPAGLFYALAAAAVLKELAAAPPPRLPLAVLTAAMLAVSCGWALRLIGIHYSLQVRELSVRNEWAYYDDWEAKQQFETPFTGQQEAIRQALRRQAIRGAGGVRMFASPWPRRLFDITQ